MPTDERQNVDLTDLEIINAEKLSVRELIDHAGQTAARIVSEAKQNRSAIERIWNNWKESAFSPQPDVFYSFVSAVRELLPAYLPEKQRAYAALTSLARSPGLGPELKSLFADLNILFDHDIAHISSPQEVYSFLSPQKAKGQDARVINPDRIEAMGKVVENFPAFAGLHAIPYEYVQALLSVELGGRLPIEEINLTDLFRAIAQNVTMRFAPYNEVYEISHNAQSSKPHGVEIYCTDQHFTANRGIIGMIVYNLVKNAAKAHQSVVEKAKENGVPITNPHQTVRITASQDAENLTFTVWDNGGGFDLRRILYTVKGIIQEYTSSGVDFTTTPHFAQLSRALGTDVARTFASWQWDSRAIRVLNIGALLDLLKLPGFRPDSWDMTNSITSGVGLFGIELITKKLGGSCTITIPVDGDTEFIVSVPWGKSNMQQRPQIAA